MIANAWSAVLTSMGVDVRQYRLLVGLLRQLSERRELTGQLGLDRRAFNITRGVFGFFGLILCAFVLAGVSAAFFLTMTTAATMMFLVSILVSDAADAFMNPAEAFVLAHQPIDSRSYIAAKTAYILSAAARIAVPLNAAPALAGLALPGTRWFYPATHLGSALLAAVLTALLTCGLFGVLFRVVPIVRLRAAAMWMQIGMGIVIPVVSQLPRFVQVRPDMHAPLWSAVPVTWFVYVGLIGQPGRILLVWPIALPAMLLAALFIVFGARSLSQGYLTSVVLMMRASHTGTRGRRHGLGALVRALTGRPSGRAAFGFVVRMCLRDWQFRRVFLQSNVMLVLVFVVNAFQTGGTESPFGSVFAPVHLLPHMIGFASLSACSLLTNSSQYRAAWVFTTVPADSFRGFAGGIFWALWIPVIAVPHIVLALAALRSWGPVPTLAFMAYSTALASLYLSGALVAIKGLPFSAQPRSTSSAMALPLMLAFFLVAGGLVAIQYVVLFRHVSAVLASAAVCGVAAAVLTARSLRGLEQRLALDADRLTAGPIRMFEGLAVE